MITIFGDHIFLPLELEEVDGMMQTDHLILKQVFKSNDCKIMHGVFPF